MEKMVSNMRITHVGLGNISNLKLCDVRRANSPQSWPTLTHSKNKGNIQFAWDMGTQIFCILYFSFVFTSIISPCRARVRMLKGCGQMIGGADSRHLISWFWFNSSSWTRHQVLSNYDVNYHFYSVLRKFRHCIRNKIFNQQRNYFTFILPLSINLHI